MNPPNLAVLTPSNNTTVFGTINVSGSASPATGVSGIKVWVFVDDVGIANPATGTSNWNFSLDTTKLADGNHVVSAVAVQGSGAYISDTVQYAVNVTVNNSAPPPSPVITSALTATGTAGTAFSYQITATNSPTTFGATGLPNGLSVNTGNGLISGTPAAAGVSNVTLSAINSGGTGTATLNLTINTGLSSPPVITQQPQNTSAAVGSSAAFWLSATGSAPLSYQWFILAPGGSSWVNIIGATNSTYTFTNAQSSDNGTLFYCQASNSAGSVPSAAAKLTVTAPPAPPVITQQPQNAAVQAGQPASFSIGATGSGPLNYQWQYQAPGTSGFFNILADTSALTSTYTLSSTQLSNNGGQFRCVVTNSASSVTSAAATLTVTSVADTTSPTVTITSPANGTTVSRTITVSGTAADNVAVSNVQVSIDGGAYAAAFGTGNWTFSLNTTTLSNASHTISAKATDTSGNASMVASISVTVNNSVADTIPPSVPTGLAAVAVSSTQIHLSWNASTDNVGVAGYNVFRCLGLTCSGAIFVFSSVSTSFSDTGLAPGTTYSYAVSAFDAAGNISAQSAGVSAATLGANAAPNLPPIVSAIGTNAVDVDTMTPGLQIYEGTSVTYTGTASDPDGDTISWQWLYTVNGGSPIQMASGTGAVQPVTFNYPVGIAPKTYVWILSASDGFSTVQQSLTVNIIARPVNAPPTVSIATLSTTTVSGTISLTAFASGSVGIAQVQFKLDGNNLGSPVTSAPFTFTWNPIAVSPGNHTITAVATDMAGYQATSAPITVTVVRTADATPGLRNALAIPNPAFKTDPVIRAFLGMVNSVEITIFDASGHTVNSGSVSGASAGISNNQYYYDYKWIGSKASGVYFAVVHGKAADGSIIRARVKFAVVN